MVSKKLLIGSIITVAICIVLSVSCAIIRKFDVVSSILLGVVVLLAIFVACCSWREIVEQKNDKDNY